MATNNVQYIGHSNMGIELILCENSTISYPTHNHVSVFTTGIVLKGSIVLTTNNDVATYKSNESFIIPPYVPHSICAPKNYTLLSLCIDKNIAVHSDADKIRSNIITLLTSALHTQKHNQYQTVQLLNCLDLDTVFREMKAYKDWHCGNQNPFIKSLRNQLELYPEDKFSIEEMAQNAYVSKYHFIRSFKAEVGLTPHQFQLQNRIRKAQRLMHHTDTITEVALTTGFCDQSHFTRQFEKQVGISPLAYKLSSQTVHIGSMV